LQNKACYSAVITSQSPTFYRYPTLAVSALYTISCVRKFHFAQTLTIEANQDGVPGAMSVCSIPNYLFKAQDLK
jgi:hypothetical protein